MRLVKRRVRGWRDLGRGARLTRLPNLPKIAPVEHRLRGYGETVRHDGNADRTGTT